MNNENRIKKTSLNALTNYLRFFFTMVISFWLIPFIINNLGQTIYGLWTLSFSIIGFFSLLDFGFGLGVVKWTREARVTQDYEHRNRMLSTVFFIYLVIAGVAILLLSVFSLFYANLFSIPKGLQSTAVAVLLILGVRTLVIQLPLSLFKGALFGEQRIYLVNCIQIIGTLVYAASAYLVLSNQKGILYLAGVNCLAFLFENILYLILSYKNIKNFKLSIKYVEKKYMKEAFSFSLYSFITSVAGLVLFQTDTIIIQLMTNLSLVGLYAVAIKITEYSFMLTKQLVNVLTPLISELKEKKEDQAIRFLLTDLSRYIMTTGVMLTATMYVFGKDLLVFWVGSAFIDATIPLLILLTSFMCTIPELIASNVLTMTGQQSFTARISFQSVVVNVCVSLILIQPLGLIGVALGTLTSTIINNVGFTLHKAAKTYNFSYLSYFSSVYIPALIPGVFLVAIGFLIKNYFPVTSVWDMIGKAIPGAFSYLIVFWIFFTKKDMKQRIRNKLRTKRTRR